MALPRFEAIGDPGWLAQVHQGLGHVAMLNGDFVEGHTQHATALRLRRRASDDNEIMDSLVDLAAVEAMSGWTPHATAHFREALKLQNASPRQLPGVKAFQLGVVAG